MLRRLIKTIFFIFLIFIAISCKKSKLYETEPNNTFSQANRIELNSEIYGYLESETDIDNFIFESLENQVVRIELAGVKGVNHAMQIWRVENSRVTPLKIIDDNRKSSPEEFANLHIPPGIYIITVMHGNRDEKKGNTENPYMLRLTSRHYISEEEEPNDTPVNANHISDSVQITGYFSPGQNLMNEQGEYREEDWFKFTIDENENLPLLADIQLKGVSGVDAVIQILDSGLNLIASSDNSGPGGDESLQNIGIKVPGTYYILLYSKNYQYNNSEAYFLNFRLKPHEAGTEIENNDTIERANIISGNEIRGRINSTDDVDFFLFKPDSRNNLYRVELATPAALDSLIEVYDHRKSKIMEVDNSGPGGSEIIPNLFINEAVYLKVSSKSGFDSNAEYVLRMTPLNIEGPVEKEPNNNLRDANILDKSISGFITYKDDIDYFLIKSDSRKKLNLTIRGVKDGIIKVSTTDPLGYIIRTVEVKGDQTISMVEMFDKKGYIIVEPVKAAYNDPYHISIEEAR